MDKVLALFKHTNRDDTHQIWTLKSFEGDPGLGRMDTVLALFKRTSRDGTYQKWTMKSLGGRF